MRDALHLYRLAFRHDPGGAVAMLSIGPVLWIVALLFEGIV